MKTFLKNSITPTITPHFSEHGGHGINEKNIINAPYGAWAFKKISDDDQKIYSKNYILERKDTEMLSFFEHEMHETNEKN